MPKAWIVAKTEYLASVRTKAFILGVLMTPILVGVMILVQKFAEDKVDVRDQRFAVIDHTGEMWPVIEAAARQYNQRGIYDPEAVGEKKQVRPRFVPVAYDPEGRERQDVELELSERVRGEELFAFVILDAGLIESEAEDAAVSYYTQTPSAQALPGWLRSTIHEDLQRRRSEAVGVDREVIQHVIAPMPFREMGLAKARADGGVVEAEAQNKAITFGIPFGAMMLLTMMVMSAAPALLNAVIEEKMQRISELLVSSISPFQLMLGKLLGGVMVAMTLSLIYVGAAVYALHHFGLGSEVPLRLYVWFVVFIVLATLMYGSIFAAMGAACSELKDAQNMMGPVMLIVMLPLFCTGALIQSPNGPIAVWLSLFPTATPMLMMLRLASQPGPPAWQVALGLTLTLSATLACVWAGAKVFRIGILSHGQTPGFKQLIGWVFSR